MRFRQLDRIVEIEPGVRLVATRRLSASEDYLEDHFPRFPVMPGVLMLEALFQAGVWLVYHSERFRQAMVLLKEARNVKFTDFVQPGQTLTVTVEVLGKVGPLTKLKAQGMLGESVAVSGRLVLEQFNWADRCTDMDPVDRQLRREMRSQLKRLLAPPGEAAAAL